MFTGVNTMKDIKHGAREGRGSLSDCDTRLAPVKETGTKGKKIVLEESIRSSALQLCQLFHCRR